MKKREFQVTFLKFLDHVLLPAEDIDQRDNVSFNRYDKTPIMDKSPQSLRGLISMSLF